MPAEPTKVHVAKTFAYTSPFVACRIDPQGKFVFAGAEDNKVIRFEIETGNKLEFVAHNSWVRAIGFNSPGDVLLTGGYDGRLLWWPANATEKPEPTRSVDTRHGWVRAMSVSPDGTLIATCGNDRMVRIWNLADGNLVREFAGHESHVYHVAFHPNGKDLASGDLKSFFLHWNLDSGQQTRKIHIPAMHKYDPTFMADIGGPHSLAFSKDGKWLVAGGITNVSNAFAGIGNPAVSLIDWEAGKEKVMHVPKANVNGAAWGVTFHPDGYTIGASGGGGGGHLYFWKPEEKNEFHTLNVGNFIRDLGVHPDGIHLATCHHDRQVRLLKLAEKMAAPAK